MTKTSGHAETEHHARLRRTAEALIEKGATPRTRGTTLGVDALELLYRRASNPESAADALKLLHELQTHQVELDLLYEQLQANEYEISGELAHYKALFDHAPVAYLVVANDGRIIESNEAAAALFGLSPEQLTEQAVSELLAPTSREEVSGIFQRPLTPGSRTSCTANLLATDKAGPSHRITINATSDNQGESVLMVLCHTPDPAIPGP